ncbi:glycosyltransferase family 2 protein [Aequorivita viscosa]|uniref:Glycosyltransferase, catalytic subunit of cellulose synthase and poly-beta-1,6-N-acetylglucosamine synthase n=1 Tax=Aequorivita viscosa TaxID=797419 RepID=A0A1M6FU94_9FLAO|nr:glycosyltransferase [Aequorivita viscosa]SDW73228.1 Glycosyltransferase, catalytic subunit of cellulose synthase and poly-beta-1,6-N-acetylglucosamine synthase [Aequorivita viscosa]SHJ01265.1 Glycosyltransferase, catalytic subunit of cellulose synthase and poly-beta-1,6-N-acetylglucosamine synthase [Aequorivita viscosa]
MDTVIYFYQYAIFFYAICLTVIYLVLGILGYLNILREKTRYTLKEEHLLNLSPKKAPGISVVAGAYNEEVIIIDSVNSLLSLNYPNFEVVIVNDGSVDKTLDLLINHFHLEEIPFPYVQNIRCRPVKRIFRSTNRAYSRLTVVDKENGGTKADAMNAGINVAKYDYFINTDVDCILAKDTLTKVVLPVLDSKITVIAVGATMRMVNSCEIKDGDMVAAHPPRRFIPTFQETEYLRSYLLAKMGWAALNAIPNVSGGFGLFNRSVVIEAGGYDPLSHAEDMDMTIRMVVYMRDNGRKYKIVQIPDTCCWTEGPPNIQVLSRQRTRWGRGLLQIFIVHRRFLFNRRYGRLGLVILPYALLFEFVAPIIEVTGFFVLLFLLITQQINFSTFWLMLIFVFLIGFTMSLIAISYDISVKKQYKLKEYFRLIFFSSFEAVLYHPLIVIFSLRGYWQFLTQENFEWGAMTRQGFSKKSSSKKAVVEKQL